MLALTPGRPVPADRLVEGLWGDEPPSSAAKMVQLYVSHLRRVLDGKGVRIVTRGRAYELQLDGGEVDAVHFERLLEAARPREALALWRCESPPRARPPAPGGGPRRRRLAAAAAALLLAGLTAFGLAEVLGRDGLPRI